jgi:hypothetical protein
MPELGNLDSFISEVAATCDGLQQSSEKMSDLRADLDSLEDKIEEAIKEIKEDAKKFDTDLESDHEDYCNGVEEFTNLLEKLATQVMGDFIKTFEEVGDTTETAVDKHRASLQSGFDELENDGFKVAEQGVEDCEGITSSQDTDTQKCFDDFESHCEDQKDIATTFKDATVTIFTSVSENLTQNLTKSLTDGFDTFDTGLTTGLATIGKGLTEVSGLVTDGFNLFEKGADDLGETLIKETLEIFTNAGKNMTDILMERMTQMFTNLCEDVFQGLIQEFVTQGVTAAVGQAITTATAPWAPFIIAANVALGIIDKLLSLLSV